MRFPKQTSKISKERSLVVSGPSLTHENLESFLSTWTSTIKDDAVVWYRGHDNISYQLVPTLLREPQFTTLFERYCGKESHADVADLEQKLLHRFRDYAKTKGRSELYSDPARMTGLDWLCAAQHHGMPTRLLDWTTNPLVAVYFACVSSPLTDGAIWRLPLGPLPTMEDLTIDLNDSMSEEEQRHKICRAHEHNSPVFIRPPQHVARIGAQASRLILASGSASVCGASLLDHSPRLLSRLSCISVSWKSKPQLLKKLEIYDIHSATMFPGLDGFCSYIRQF